MNHHRNWGVPPSVPRFPPRYYVMKPTIERTMPRERFVCGFLMAVAVMGILSFAVCGQP